MRSTDNFHMHKRFMINHDKLFKLGNSAGIEQELRCPKSIETNYILRTNLLLRFLLRKLNN